MQSMHKTDDNLSVDLPDAANDAAYGEVLYIKSATLSWRDLWTSFGMERDGAGRWDTSGDTQPYVSEYLADKRRPSRAWPLSYAKAMLTQKFARLVVEREPGLAVKLGIAERIK